MVFEPDAADIEVTVLKTLQITSNKSTVPGIFFTEPNAIEESVLEYTTTPANCELMCACKGSEDEIAPLWKDVDTFNNRGVAFYIPYIAGEQVMATKVTAFQLGPGDLEIIDIPDYSNSSKDIKGQHTLVIAEVREGMTEKDIIDRFVEGIKALEEAEADTSGWKTTGKANGRGKGKSSGNGK